MPFNPEDQNTWIPLIRDVISRRFGGSFPHYVDLDEMVQDCLIRLVDVIPACLGKNIRSIENFVRAAVQNDVRDYLEKQHRAFKREGTSAYPWEERVVRDTGGDFVRVGRDEEMRVYDEWASDVLQTEVNDEVQDEEIEAAKVLLTGEQYRAYNCRRLLSMTQEETACYLGITREAVASRQRKAYAKMERAGYPVPKRSA
jgi:RNA polymerase sigma factor (sigma-70 family)